MPRRTEPEPYAAKIGARIQELRTERSMTLAELGEVSGLSKGHISTIEHGLASITVETIQRLAKAFELPALYILLSPGEDEREQVMELARKLPRVELVKLRRTLQAAAKQGTKKVRTLPGQDMTTRKNIAHR